MFLAIVWIMGLLYALIPFIVMLQLSWLNSKLKKASDDAVKIGEASSSWSMALATELKIQNSLTRQLLRAYGHEPEA